MEFDTEDQVLFTIVPKGTLVLVRAVKSSKQIYLDLVYLSLNTVSSNSSDLLPNVYGLIFDDLRGFWLPVGHFPAVIWRLQTI